MFKLEIWNAINQPDRFMGIIITTELPQKEAAVDTSELGGRIDTKIKALWRTSTHTRFNNRYTVLVK